MRELIERIGLPNAIVGVLGVLAAILVIGAGFDFDVVAMLELLVTVALVTVALGAFAGLAHVAGLILDAIEERRTNQGC